MNLDPKAISQNKTIQMAGLLVLALAVLYALSVLQITASWQNNPSFLFLGFAGFFLVHFAAAYANDEEKIGFVQKPAFGVVYIVAVMAAYIVALTFYFQNNVALSGEPGAIKAFGTALDYVLKNWWGSLMQDPYLSFAIAGFFGLLALIVREKHGH